MLSLLVLLAPCGVLAECQAACDGGDASACNEVGARWYEAGKDRSAREAWERGCGKGLGAACVNLAWMLLDGQGGRADRERANGLFGAACARGDRSACGGQGLTLGDHPDAAQLLRRGCEGGEDRACEAACDRADAAGCAGFARALLGRGEERRARMLFAVACAAGLPAACAETADPARFPTRAKVWQEASLRAGGLVVKCKKGNRAACLDLADHFLGGTGVRKDPLEAARLYDKACKRRPRPGCARARWAVE